MAEHLSTENQHCKSNLQSETYRQNFARNKKLVADLRETCQIASTCTSDTLLRKNHKAKKLLVDDRIAMLLDPGSPFLELSQLAGLHLYEREGEEGKSFEECRRGGIVTGIGIVNKMLCMVIANDPTVRGGVYFPITVKKHIRAQCIALENKLPVVHLVDSAGANLLFQEDIFPDDSHFGKIFFNQAAMSARGIPQLAVVLGMCTAGGAYIPCMSDETIMVRANSTIFLGGPALVHAATGDVVDAQNLGGADVHCAQSGVADYYAESEAVALRMARSIISRWDTSKTMCMTRQANNAPLYAPEHIYGLIPDMSSGLIGNLDVRAVIACLLDRSIFLEFKKRFDENIVCGFGSIHGHEVGIIMNNGVLLSSSALKATHFIQLCCARKRPILFFQNVAGFMIGRAQEREGIAKHGAKMVHAVSTASVPKITVVIGGSYGAGNYAMCGRAFGPRFMFMWPDARIAVMSGEHAGKVMTGITKSKAPSDFANKIGKMYENKSHAYYGSARLWDDGVIDPAQTRDILGMALAVCTNVPVEETKHGIFRM